MMRLPDKRENPTYIKDVNELINYVDYLEDIKKDYEFLKSEVLRVAKTTEDLY